MSFRIGQADNKQLAPLNSKIPSLKTTKKPIFSTFISRNQVFKYENFFIDFIKQKQIYNLGSTFLALRNIQVLNTKGKVNGGSPKGRSHE